MKRGEQKGERGKENSCLGRRRRRRKKWRVREGNIRFGRVEVWKVEGRRRRRRRRGHGGMEEGA